MIQSSTDYRFDETAATRAVDFMQRLPHVKGPKAGTPFVLELWQREIVRDLFGWKRPDGTRRYRTAYVEVPRKNGKSFLASAIALYLLFADGEAGAEVYSCAGDREQASLVFNVASEQVRQVPFLAKNSTTRPSYKLLRNDRGTSYYKAVSADAKLKHGFNPHGVLADELHVWPSRELWDVMESGKGARLQPLTFAITTAGYDRSSICWELHQHALRVQADPSIDEAFYARVYGADPAEDWTEPAVWAKANPNLGVSVSEQFLRDECQRAQEMPSYENTFRQLYLNQWTQQAVRWLPMVAWDACRGCVAESELIGKPCWAALDLALTRDLSAFAMVWPTGETEDGPERFAVKLRFWAPSEPLTKRQDQDGRQIRNFGKQGHITLTEGDVQDHRRIIGEVAELCGGHGVESVLYDPAKGGSVVAQELQDEHGIKVEKFSQTPASYTPAMELLESLVLGGRIEHFGDPVLRWNAENVSVERNEKRETMFPVKPYSAAKIDGIVALLMALSGAMQGGDTRIIDVPVARIL